MKVERRFGGALISESSLLLSSERWLISRRSFLWSRWNYAEVSKAYFQISFNTGLTLVC
jgi:hypothetical protein